MDTDLLRVEEASFHYEDSQWKLGEISFSLKSGEMVAIIGPNGSGKSTLLRVAAGVLAPQQGRVILEGRQMSTLDRREVARTLGYLPQQIQHTFDYTVEEVVAMGRFPHLSGWGFLSAADVRAVEDSMRQTETLDQRGRHLSHLSGGERQRVFLASVLAQEPRLLLLDEPTTGLDIHHQAQFFRLLRRLSSNGIAVAVVTHDLNMASFHCGRLVLLSKGRHVCEGTPEKVIRPEVISRIYGESVIVEQDARRNRPIVLPGPEGGLDGNGGQQ